MRSTYYEDVLSRFKKFDGDDEGIRLPSSNLARKLSPTQLSVGGRNAFMACQKVLEKKVKTL